MSTGFLEITMELISLRSTHLEPKTFYTVLLDVDQKEVELPQKKSLTSPGSIVFNESLSLKVGQTGLEKAHNEAKVIIYSIQNYGKKRLFGAATMEINVQQAKQMKLPLLSCSDKQAFIQVRYRVVRIESRVSSSRNSQSSFLKYFPNQEKEKKDINMFETFNGMNSRSNSRELLMAAKETVLKSSQQQCFPDVIRSTAFQLPYRAEVPEHKVTSQSISNNLSLMQKYEKAIARAGTIDQKDIENLQSEFAKRTTPKALVLEKIVKMGKDLNSIHQKEDLLNNDDEIEKLAEEEDKVKSKDQSSFFPTLEGCEQSIIQSKIRLESHTLDFVYFDSIRPPKLKVQKVESQNVRRLSMIVHTYSSDVENPFQERDASKKDNPTTDTKSPVFIRPKQRREFIQEWENDDVLVKNLAYEIANDAQGNLGYVKLSNLNHLRKKIKEIKDSNANLLKTNEQLAKNERFLTKKLEIANEIIGAKQKILAVQFQSLREQFKEVTKKLLEKYNEQILRENKMKEYQKELKNYETKVRELMNTIQLKNKQVQHLKSLLAMDEQMQRDKNQQQQQQDSFAESPSIIRDNVLTSNKSKEKKDLTSRSNSGKKIFPNLKKDSLSISKDYFKPFSIAELPFESKKQLDIIKGISPNMRDFFVSFIAKPDDVTPQGSISQIPSQHYLKKGRLHRRDISGGPSAQDLDVIPGGYESLFRNI